MRKRRTKKEIQKARYLKGYNEQRAHYLDEWKAIGETIKAKRLRLGLSQGEVAEQCGLSRSYYRHLEQGYNDPRKSKVSVKILLAEALCFEYEELWGD